VVKLCIIFLFLLPAGCFAQYIISGKVFNATDKKAIANASVFLNNAVVGTKSDENGNFTLTSVRPGQYDLVVSIVGFETFHKQVMVTGDVKLLELGISPKVFELQEVKIKANNNWARDYELFKRYFFGTSEFAKDCKMITKNLPDILDLDYDRKTKTLTAKSSDFFEIENKALGYKIRYQLVDFKNDQVAFTSYYEGIAAFEELKGSKSEHRKWEKNRMKAFEGSSVHFLRSLLTNSFTDEGFRVLRLIRKPNPDYNGFNNKYTESLVKTPLVISDFVRLTDVKGEYALSFNDCLYVMYNAKRAHISAKEANNLLVNPEYLDDPLTTTVIFNQPYALFDENGIIINPLSVAFDGNWGTRLIAELLPVDYVPVISPAK
jgi:hypothetical protein